jgi:hypothetical protein
VERRGQEDEQAASIDRTDGPAEGVRPAGLVAVDDDGVAGRAEEFGRPPGVEARSRQAVRGPDGGDGSEVEATGVDGVGCAGSGHVGRPGEDEQAALVGPLCLLAESLDELAHTRASGRPKMGSPVRLPEG